MDENILNKLKGLIKNAHKFDDMQFRLLVEDLVKQGGKPAERMLVELALTDTIFESIRINIIRCMGYIPTPAFLIALRKILESDESIRLRKAAIISISKFNDKRALDMLNSALKRITTPILQDSISQEISRIKKDNPILALMPKFLNGVNDPRTFRTTLDILKKILNPSDAQVFIYHLKSDIPFIGDGAFEVLCWRGDESVKFSIFEYFRKKMEQVDCIDAEECVSLLDLLIKLEQFLIRNPDTFNFVLKDLKDIYKRTKDPKVKTVLVNIFSSNHKREVLSFLEDIYNTEPERRELIIGKLTGNEDGAFILIYKYKNDPDLAEPLLKSLLSTQKGADFVYEQFDSLSTGYQHLVLEKIDETNYKFFREMIKAFLECNDVGRKKFALDKIRQHQDSHFKDILLDPKRQKEFFRMQKDYLDTISQVHFVQAFKVFINQMVEADAARVLIRRYLTQKDSFIHAEPVIRFEEDDDLVKFCHKILKYNNKDLNIAILELFSYLKILDYKSLSKFQNFLNEFKNERGARISPDEKGMVNKLGLNLNNLLGDLKRIEKGNTNIDHFIEKTFPDYELLEYILKNHVMAFFMNRERVFDRIKRVFKLTNDIDAFDSVKFFLSRPEFCQFFKEEIKRSTESTNYLLKNDADKLMETMPKDTRFVLKFESRLVFSGTEDQIKEVIPEIEITDTDVILPSDIVIADTPSLERLGSENRLNTKKILVFLKDKKEFNAVKDLKPVAFPPPLSFYKVLRALVPVMFPPRPANPQVNSKDQAKAAQ